MGNDNNIDIVAAQAVRELKETVTYYHTQVSSERVYLLMSYGGMQKKMGWEFPKAEK